MSHSVPPGAGYSIIPQTPNHSNNYIYSQLFTTDHTAARPIPESPGPQAAVAGAFVAGAIVGSTGSTIGSATTETILKLDGRFKVSLLPSEREQTKVQKLNFALSMNVENHK